MTRRKRIGLSVGVVLLVAAAPAGAGFEAPGCCVCVDSGPQVIFCAEPASSQASAQAGERCTAAGGNFICKLIMVGDPSPESCGAMLAEDGFTCPIRNGAPATGGLGLAALLLALPGLGIGALRRRSARRS